MNKWKDLLFDTGFKRDKLKTPYKLLLLSCFLLSMVLLYLIFGDYGIIGAGIYGGISYYLGMGLFLLITKIIKKDIYYSEAYLNRDNKKQ